MRVYWGQEGAFSGCTAALALESTPRVHVTDIWVKPVPLSLLCNYTGHSACPAAGLLESRGDSDPALPRRRVSPFLSRAFSEMPFVLVRLDHMRLSSAEVPVWCFQTTHLVFRQCYRLARVVLRALHSDQQDVNDQPLW